MKLITPREIETELHSSDKIRSDLRLIIEAINKLIRADIALNRPVVSIYHSDTGKWYLSNVGIRAEFDRRYTDQYLMECWRRHHEDVIKAYENIGWLVTRYNHLSYEQSYVQYYYLLQAPLKQSIQEILNDLSSVMDKP